MELNWNKRIEELCDRFERHEMLYHTGFLTPAEQAAAAHILKRRPQARFFGGYDGAQRQALVLAPSWMEAPETEVMGAVRISAPFSEGLNHRDYLGALLGLGVERDRVGDILVHQNYADVIALKPLLPFLCEECNQVGRYAVKTQSADISKLEVPVQEVKTIRCTVPQLRLDCVAAAAFNLSRSRMGEAIDQGLVSLNYVACLKREKQVGEGDVISVRGMGRATVKAVGGRSKKDRLFVVLEKLL